MPAETIAVPGWAQAYEQPGAVACGTCDTIGTEAGGWVQVAVGSAVPG